MSSDSGEEDNTKMEGFLRDWRQTAFNSGQFQTAIFIGDKLLALTSKDLLSSMPAPSENRFFADQLRV